MKTTIITVEVKLTVTSETELTENDKEQVVSEMDYDFEFSEMLNGNMVVISDTEVMETLEPG